MSETQNTKTENTHVDNKPQKIGKKSAQALYEQKVANLTPGGPGRPKGQRNYKTIYRDALIKLAELNGQEPDQMETDMLAMALTKARKGDYAFYRDVMDRLHGKPTAPMTVDMKSTNQTSINYEKDEVKKILDRQARELMEAMNKDE